MAGSEPRADGFAKAAIVTPSFARDFELCATLNRSIFEFAPSTMKHYIIVDRRDLGTFAALANGRTVVAAIEDVVPRAFFRVPWLKKRWMSTVSLPVKGWLIQQVVKICATRFVDEPVTVNVDSDVAFIRPFEASLFVRGDAVRLYKRPGGIMPGMVHVKFHRNACKMLGLPPSAPPLDDYVGNVISWDRGVAAAMCDRIESVSAMPWYAAFARRRLVSEYLTYGLFAEKVAGLEPSRAFLDSRSWCHTYWGPQPMTAGDVAGFADLLRPDDIAVSVEGYTKTPKEIEEAALTLVRARARVTSAGSAPDRHHQLPRNQSTEDGISVHVSPPETARFG
jgi:hypothetical protein